MSIDERAREMERRLEEARKPGMGLGLIKGMLVTLKHLFKRNTVIEYPDVKQDLPARTRGVIALKEENCTVCMLCARECPDWCIYIDSHKETLPPKRQGGRPRKRNVLDRFAIDYALCMYCGICVEVCPYDALFWSREFEYSEFDIRELTHEKERLSDWMSTVLPPPPLEQGALLPGAAEPEAAATAVGDGSRGGVWPGQPAMARATASAPVAAPAVAAPPEPAPPAAEPPAEAAPEPVRPDESTPDALQQPPTPAPTPVGPVASSEEAQKIYDQVLQEQLDKGSSPQVAEARAKVARVKAERGIGRAPTPIDVEKPVPSAPTKHEVSEPTPSGAPEATAPTPDPGPVAPVGETESKPKPADVGDPKSGALVDPGAPPDTGETAPDKVVEAVAGEAQAEDPEAVYERVLAEERAKGSSDAVAVARAKAARVRAQRGTRGPGG